MLAHNMSYRRHMICVCLFWVSEKLTISTKLFMRNETCSNVIVATQATMHSPSHYNHFFANMSMWIFYNDCLFWVPQITHYIYFRDENETNGI
jgi:hypothetical protein